MPLPYTTSVPEYPDIIPGADPDEPQTFGELLQRLGQTVPRSRAGRALTGLGSGIDTVERAPGSVTSLLGSLPGRARKYLFEEDPNPRIDEEAVTRVAPEGAPNAGATLGSSFFQDGNEEMVTPVAAAPAPGDNSDSGPAAMVPAPKPSPAIRAIRLPSGRMLFTNRPEYGGEEMSTAEGGRVVRAQQRQSPPPPFASDPTSDVVRQLVRRSMAATEKEAGQALPVGRQVPGAQFDESQPGSLPPGEGPGFTNSPASNETTQRAVMSQKLEDALTALQLAQAGHEQRKAALTPEQEATLGNKNIGLGQYLTGAIGQRMMKVERDRQQAVQALSVPTINGQPNPYYIADPKARAERLRMIEESADNERRNAIALGAIIAGQQVPREY